jgi:hypothetical protein
MPGIVLKARVAGKDRLLKNLRHCRSAATRLRYLTIVNLCRGSWLAILALWPIREHCYFNGPTVNEDL